MSDELRQRLTRILAEEVAPALQIDGGDVELVGLDGRVLQVRLHGVCSGCPSTIMAVIHGLEHELKQRVPEIDYLEAVP
ncbi:MAG: NifU family protein [Gemmataceae bacterium]